MAVVGLTSHIPHIVGVIAVSLVAVIPAASLARDVSEVLRPEGVEAISTQWVAHALAFGTMYAGNGNMTTSLILSTTLIHLLRLLFTHDDGSIAKRYIKPTVVEHVQKNILSHKSRNE